MEKEDIPNERGNNQLDSSITSDNISNGNAQNDAKSPKNQANIHQD